jgi:hypothetical protein
VVSKRVVHTGIADAAGNAPESTPGSALAGVLTLAATPHRQADQMIEPAGADNAPADSDGRTRGRDRRHLYPGRTRRAAPTFTEQEWAEVVVAAAAVGLTPTGFCGEAALAVARRTRPASLDPDRHGLADLQSELFDARVAVGRIGTNLNQAVTALNATGQAPEWLPVAAGLCERRMERLDVVIGLIHRRLR